MDYFYCGAEGNLLYCSQRIGSGGNDALRTRSDIACAFRFFCRAFLRLHFSISKTKSYCGVGVQGSHIQAPHYTRR